MNIDEKDVGVAAAVIAWLGSIFGGTWKISQYKAENDAKHAEHQKTMAEMDKRLTERIQAITESMESQTAMLSKLNEHHDHDMQSIRDFFRTPAGGQKFMTFPDHDIICGRNTTVLVTEIKHLTEALRENTTRLGKVESAVSELTVAVAVLEEARLEKRN